MPSRFIKRSFRKNSYYHVYNRGAYKHEIFHDEKDYLIFTRILSITLQTKPYPVKIKAYCLMPNHFHFLIWQRNLAAISQFMHSVWTQYCLYYHHKYDHSGRICEGPYKAVLVVGKEKRSLLHQYILNNPNEAGLVDWPHVGTLK